MNIYPLVRKILFLFNAETTHEFSLKLLSFLQRLHLLNLFLVLMGGGGRNKKYQTAPVNIMGLQFPNAVGLAAGLDKNAEHIDALAQCGFGFIEVGTVTPLAQPGNDKPRMFRLQADQGIINRMGFNNKGVVALLANVKKSREKAAMGPCLIGINIGKNKATPLESAVDDYIACLQQVYTQADYVTINISSPNTPGLRALQHGQGLENLLQQLKQQQTRLFERDKRYVPLLVKIAPDLDGTELAEIAQTLIKSKVDGVIATNTTNQRPESLKEKLTAEQAGGLSGAPLTDIADDILVTLLKELDGQLPVIAVGGIMSAADALRKLQLGASLVQIYSGFIYSGPALVSQSLKIIDSEHEHHASGHLY